MNVLRKIERLLTWVVNTLLVAMFSLMLTLAVVQVGLRYFLNSSLLWGDVAARNLVLWVGFLGAILAARDERHFHLDVLSRFLPAKGKVWLQRISSLFATVICYYLGTASMAFLEIEADSKTFLDLPIPVVEVIIPAGFFLMMVQFGLRTILGPSGAPPEGATLHTPLPE